MIRIHPNAMVDEGANSTVVPAIRIDEGTFVAAGSTLTRDSKAWSLMHGTPARHVAWVSAFGERIALPIEERGEWTCPHTQDRYVLDGDLLTRWPGEHDILHYVAGKKLERIVGA